MHRGFCVTLLLSWLLWSPQVFCQGGGSQLLDNKGVPGYWFPMEIGDRLLKDVTELKLVRDKVSLLQDKVDAQGRLIDLQKLDIQVSEGISEKWKSAFDEQVKVTQSQQKYYEAQLESSKKWYRSPVLWFSIGVVLSSAMAIGLNFGLAEAHK